MMPVCACCNPTYYSSALCANLALVLFSAVAKKDKKKRCLCRLSVVVLLNMRLKKTHNASYFYHPTDQTS
jgi:glucose-6-phosphate-specific signal transduction histidine kinase